jgi:hypothetical protein
VQSKEDFGRHAASNVSCERRQTLIRAEHDTIIYLASAHGPAEVSSSNKQTAPSNKYSPNSNERLIYNTNAPLTNAISVSPATAKMLFSEEDAPLLKKYIVKRLENT